MRVRKEAPGLRINKGRGGGQILKKEDQMIKNTGSAEDKSWRRIAEEALGFCKAQQE